jgi:hypothetical protein
MQMRRDAVLLRTLQLCRADIVSAMSDSDQPPDSKSLHELAELQLVIMATEGVIADKTNPYFLREFEEQAAAA